jgi:hypothetical protein
MGQISLIKGRVLEANLNMGRERCPRADLHSVPRAIRASACRHYDRRGRCIPGLGQARGGCNGRLNCAKSPRPGWRGLTGSSAPAASQEAWPELSLGTITPLDESRGGTPTGERVPQDARRIRWCGGYGPRLSAFRFLFYWLGETGVANRETTRHHPSKFSSTPVSRFT